MQHLHLTSLLCHLLPAEDHTIHLDNTNLMMTRKISKWVAQTRLHPLIQPLYHRPTGLRPLQHSYHKILEIDKTHTPLSQQTNATTASAHPQPRLPRLALRRMSMLEVLSPLDRL